MITEFLLSIFEAISAWFVGLFGDAQLPDWITGVADTFTDVVMNASGLGAWFPFVLLGAVGGFMLTLWFVLWSVKGIRWVWGLTPFSGGS